MVEWYSKEELSWVITSGVALEQKPPKMGQVWPERGEQLAVQAAGVLDSPDWTDGARQWCGSAGYDLRCHRGYYNVRVITKKGGGRWWPREGVRENETDEVSIHSDHTETP
jgi:hypothetical protein